MARLYLLVVAVILAPQLSLAAIEEGTVVEVTQDTIKIVQGGAKTQAYQVSNELLTNTIPYYPRLGWSSKFSCVRKGGKVQLDCFVLDGRLLCAWIRLDDPIISGTVAEVGKDTITIRSEKDDARAYKVAKDLVDNSRADSRYSTNYPSRFAEVKPGCRVEATGYEENGDFLITGLDVKKGKDSDK